MHAILPPRLTVSPQSRACPRILPERESYAHSFTTLALHSCPRFILRHVITRLIRPYIIYTSRQYSHTFVVITATHYHLIHEHSRLYLALYLARPHTSSAHATYHECLLNRLFCSSCLVIMVLHSLCECVCITSLQPRPLPRTTNTFNHKNNVICIKTSKNRTSKPKSQQTTNIDFH